MGWNTSILSLCRRISLTYRLRCLGWAPSPSKQPIAHRKLPAQHLRKEKAENREAVPVILSGFLFQVTSGTLEEPRCFTLTLGSPNGLGKWLQLRLAGHLPFREPGWHSRKAQLHRVGRSCRTRREAGNILEEKWKNGYFFRDIPTAKPSSSPASLLAALFFFSLFHSSRSILCLQSLHQRFVRLLQSFLSALWAPCGSLCIFCNLAVQTDSDLQKNKGPSKQMCRFVHKCAVAEAL